jgi:transcription antitermination factor NusA-like protein
LVVRSRDQGVSAVEAFSFVRGERLNALKAELGGEFPTIVQWQSSPEELIRAAFLPGEVALDSDGKQATVTLHPAQRQGIMVDGEDQIVRATSELTGLVSELTGWKISLASTENG